MTKNIWLIFFYQQHSEGIWQEVWVNPRAGAAGQACCVGEYEVLRRHLLLSAPVGQQTFQPYDALGKSNHSFTLWAWILKHPNRRLFSLKLRFIQMLKLQWQ